MLLHKTTVVVVLAGLCMWMSLLCSGTLTWHTSYHSKRSQLQNCLFRF